MLQSAIKYIYFLRNHLKMLIVVSSTIGHRYSILLHKSFHVVCVIDMNDSSNCTEFFKHSNEKKTGFWGPLLTCDVLSVVYHGN